MYPATASDVPDLELYPARRSDIRCSVYPTWRLNTVRYEASGLRCSIMDRVFYQVDNTLVLVAR
jgi:hypothetical protein